mmetsp:Transcript_34924/g.92489  ORF Transcript_34924/g.92489 Transcript_34924/m.92489 type:complete len:397 (-) Transcript_34924:1137-2327(-)
MVVSLVCEGLPCSAIRLSRPPSACTWSTLASTRRRSGGTQPCATTTYSRSRRPVFSCQPSRWKPTKVLPTSRRPELTRSRRCTIPNRCSSKCTKGASSGLYRRCRYDESQMPVPTSAQSTSHPGGLCTTQRSGRSTTTEAERSGSAPCSRKTSRGGGGGGAAGARRRTRSRRSASFRRASARMASWIARSRSSVSSSTKFRAQAKEFRLVTRSSETGEAPALSSTLPNPDAIFRMASAAIACMKGASATESEAKAHAVFARLRGSYSAMVRITSADTADSSGSCATWRFANDQAMAAMSRSRKAVSVLIAREARASNSGSSRQPSGAKAHAVFERFCEANSDKLWRTSLDTAAIRVPTRYSILAKAHAVLARPWQLKSPIFRASSAMKGAIFSVRE